MAHNNKEIHIDNMTAADEHLIKKEASEGMAALFVRQLKDNKEGDREVATSRTLNAGDDNDQQTCNPLLAQQHFQVTLIDLLDGPGHVATSKDQKVQIIIDVEDIQTRLAQPMPSRSLWESFCEFASYEPIEAKLSLSEGSPAADLIKF